MKHHSRDHSGTATWGPLEGGSPSAGAGTAQQTTVLSQTPTTWVSAARAQRRPCSPCGMVELGVHLSHPGRAASSPPLQGRQEGGFASAGCQVPKAYRCSGPQHVWWYPRGPKWSPWGRGLCTQHRDHRRAEDQEVTSPTWFGERHHTGEVAPRWPQRAAERTASVKASTGTPPNPANPTYTPGTPPPTTCIPLSLGPQDAPQSVPTSGHPCRGAGKDAAGSARRLQIQLAGS